jgi:hypothetical protein
LRVLIPNPNSLEAGIYNSFFKEWRDPGRSSSRSESVVEGGGIRTVAK